MLHFTLVYKGYNEESDFFSHHGLVLTKSESDDYRDTYKRTAVIDYSCSTLILMELMADKLTKGKVWLLES